MAQILISGAGIAGSIVAARLAATGHDVTVVERAERLGGTGGHAVDLAGVSVEVVERMGLWPAIEAAAVDRPRLELRAGGRTVRMDRPSENFADRHVEIQRDDLIRILAAAAETAGARIRFSDEPVSLDERADAVAVGFASGAAADYDIVIGADGLHSGVRRLAFGPESAYRHDLGGFLCVFTLPNESGLDREVVGLLDVDRSAYVYPVDDGRLARALMLFRDADAAGIHHRDDAGQRGAIRRVYGGIAGELPFDLGAAETADDFYFDSISQIRMARWSRDRVTLVGDAGYSPGPAVGGGTALAVVGAHVLAEALLQTPDDPGGAFRATERIMAGPVAQGHKVGPSALKRLVPGGRLEARMMPALLRALGRMPRWMLLALFSLQGTDRRRLDDYSPAPVPAG